MMLAFLHPVCKSCPPLSHPLFSSWENICLQRPAWGICHYIHYDIFYICSKKPGLNYTGELLKTALNAIIIYCISNSLQQLITLLNLVFLKKFSILKLILPAMNKQGQPLQASFGKESLDSGKQFYWQPWDWASVSPGSILCIWGNRLNISHEIRICLQWRRPRFDSWVGKIP